MFKVTGHIFNEQTGKHAGKFNFTTHDFALAEMAAEGSPHFPGHNVNVDFETGLRIGRRYVWVDCNVHSLEGAAEQLMQAADMLRRGKIKAV